MTRFSPECGVRALTIKTEYDRACRKGRLPDGAGKVFLQIRDSASKLLSESKLEKAERLENMWNEIDQGTSTRAEFRAKWSAMLDDTDDQLPQVRDSESLGPRSCAVTGELKMPDSSTQLRRPETRQEVAD